MKIVYAQEEPPAIYRKSLFLAGPTPRTDEVSSWRPEALKLLADYGYDGVVFVPEDRVGRSCGDSKLYDKNQIEWEEACLNKSDCILVWIPRDLATMPGFTTNIEYGRWESSGKVIFGAPDGAPKTKYQRYYTNKLKIPHSTTLDETVLDALKFIDDGALRKNGDRCIPHYIWRTEGFQRWYTALQTDNRYIVWAKIEWVHLTGKERNIISLFAMNVETRHHNTSSVVTMPSRKEVLIIGGFNILASQITL